MCSVVMHVQCSNISHRSTCTQQEKWTAGAALTGKLVAVEEIRCNHQEAIAGKLVRQQLKVLELVAVNVCITSPTLWLSS